MPSRKQNQTQKLIESIMIQYKLTDINEAWWIYRERYEIDKELDGKLVDEIISKHHST